MAGYLCLLAGCQQSSCRRRRGLVLKLTLHPATHWRRPMADDTAILLSKKERREVRLGSVEIWRGRVLIHLTVKDPSWQSSEFHANDGFENAAVHTVGGKSQRSNSRIAPTQRIFCDAEVS